MTSARNTQPSAGIRNQLEGIIDTLQATPREAERAIRDAVLYAGRRVRTRARREIDSEINVAKGRQSSIQRRLRLYRKRYPNSSRVSVWLGMMGIGAEVYYTKALARSAFAKQRTNPKRVGQVNYIGPSGTPLPRTFWMDAHGHNNPIAFQRTGPGRGAIQRAYVPFARTAGHALVKQGIGAELEVVTEFERRLRVLIGGRR